jgi:hypothetical protein
MVGEQKVLLVLATYGPRPYTIDSVAAALKATDQFVRTSSFGRARLKTRIVPYLNTFATESRSCGWDDAGLNGLIAPPRAALEDAGYQVAAWDRIVYVVVGSNCSFHGAAIGREALLTEAPQRWLLLHELGHTYGLAHAASTLCGVCPINDRGDPFSPMGDGAGFTDFSTYEKTLLGWLPASTYARGNGKYALALATARNSAPHALVVETAAGQYWLERRAGQGLVVRLVDPDKDEPPFRPQSVLLLNPSANHRPWFAPGEVLRVPGTFNATLASGRVRFAWADTVAPSTPRILDASTGTSVRVRWTNSFERGSGIAYYSVAIDGKEAARAGAREEGALLTPTKGGHSVSVRAIDRAGNRSGADIVSIHVTSA